MRRPLLLAIALSSLACHHSAQTRAPEPTPAAELDALLPQLVEVSLDPNPLACDRLDAELARLGDSSVGHEASYARAEIALHCDRPERWLALHEALARADYMPSLVRLGDDAIWQHDWTRALAIVERIAERSDSPGERERLERVEQQLIHARWVEHGDRADFTRLERELERAIVRDARQLDPRAALIRLYVEQAAITGTHEPLLLAQITEREARKIADALGTQSPALELASGFVRELEGDRPAAVAAWTKAIELNAALVEPRLWLGLAAIDRRDFVTARTQLQLYVDVHPEQVDAVLALAVATRESGDSDGAAQLLARVAALDPDDPRPHWSLAMIYDPERGTETDANEIQLLSSYHDSLASYVAIYDRVGPRSCPSRGAAGPDRACAQQAAALDRQYQEALDRLAVSDELLGLVSRWTCRGGPDRNRRERLLELERAAAEASKHAPAPEPAPE